MKRLVFALLLVACSKEDKAQVEQKTEEAADTIRSGALEARDKAKEVAGAARDRLAPRLEELEAKIRKAADELAAAPTETAKEAARKALDKLKEEKAQLEAQLRE